MIWRWSWPRSASSAFEQRNARPGEEALGRGGFALTLDAGEAAAMALAITRHADLLLIDEHDGRRAASAHGLRIRGTVGVLVSARLQGLLPSLRPVLDAQLGAVFRLDQALYLDALASVGEESG